MGGACRGGVGRKTWARPAHRHGAIMASELSVSRQKRQIDSPSSPAPAAASRASRARPARSTSISGSIPLQQRHTFVQISRSRVCKHSRRSRFLACACTHVRARTHETHTYTSNHTRARTQKRTPVDTHAGIHTQACQTQTDPAVDNNRRRGSDCDSNRGRGRYRDSDSGKANRQTEMERQRKR